MDWRKAERDLILKGNEQLMAKRRELGIGVEKTRPATRPDDPRLDFLGQILDSGRSLPASEVLSGDRTRWDAFNSDAHPALIRAVKAIKRWYNDGIPAGRSLLMSGGYGCGKTHLAKAIADLYGYHAVYADETELFKSIQDTYNRHSQESEEAIKMRLRRAKLLVFDDLGSYETQNLAWIQNIYRAIFDGRCDQSLPCLFTSNMPLDGLIERIGGRNFDRLCGALETEYYIDLFAVPSYRIRHLVKSVAKGRRQAAGGE